MLITSPNVRQKRVVVGEVKARKYEKPYNKNLVRNERMIEVYRLAKAREEISEDVTNARRIKWGGPESIN